jgi:hypothetical protein
MKLRSRIANAYILDFEGSGANFKKARRADPDALGERESLACQIGPKFKLCTRTAWLWDEL